MPRMPALMRNLSQYKPYQATVSHKVKALVAVVNHLSLRVTLPDEFAAVSSQVPNQKSSKTRQATPRVGVLSIGAPHVIL